MEVNKIKSKYCTDKKVQVMFSNAPKQIICSSDGYLYLREKDITVHAYLSDPESCKMPYRKYPSSVNHANHLFEYDKPYVKITSYRNMRPPLLTSLSSGSFLSFLYFIKTEDGGAICAELDLHAFCAEEEETQILSTKELNDFLYGIEELDGKCILENIGGIKYTKFRNEELSIKKDFIDISDEGIIKQYNLDKKYYGISLFNCFGEEREEQSCEVSKIEDIHEQVTLTYHGMFLNNSPRLLTIKGNEIYVYEFSVTYCGKDCFKVKSKKRKISFNRDEILEYADDCSYTEDPDFI